MKQNKSMPTTISVCIVTWNSMKFIKSCLDSIFKQNIFYSQEAEDFKLAVNVVDNSSRDGTREFILKNYPQVHLLKNINNLGFSKPNNQAIKMHQTDWVLIMNPDVILEPDYLQKMLKSAKESADDVAALGSKIMKSETVMEDGLPQVLKTKKIDSFGLQIKKSRQVLNIGEGQEDAGQYDQLKQVFGFAGTCVMFRRQALEDIKYREEYYDESFFMYQEDFDLAYRLQLLGWKSIFVPRATAYHFRSAKAHTLKIWHFLKIIKARRSKSKIVNYHSYKNHFATLLKNEIGENFIRHLPFIFWFEFKKFVYLFLFEFSSLKSLKDFFKNYKNYYHKRKVIQQRRKVTSKEIREWFK